MSAAGPPSTEMLSEQRRPGRIGPRLVRANVYVFLGLLAAGVFLGVPLPVSADPTPIVRGATVLLIPAGLQVLAGCLARLLGVRSRRRDLPAHYWTVLTFFAIFGLALLGAGILSIAHGRAWRLLLLPFLVGGEVIVIRTIFLAPARSSLQARSARHGGPVLSAQATIGLLVLMLLGVALILWSLGIADFS